MKRPLTSQIVIDNFIDIIDSQDKKGFEKYGKSIDEASNQDYNWELMALEETADLQKYLVRRIMQVTGELIKAKEEISKQQQKIELLENELNNSYREVNYEFDPKKTFDF